MSLASLPALPIPDDVEADIARALYLQDLEVPQRSFWPLEATRLLAERGTLEALGAEVLESVDAKWRQLNRQGVTAVIHAAPQVTTRVMSTVNGFPEAERAWAYSYERSRIGDAAGRQRQEDEVHRQLLGPEYERDASWLARLGKVQSAGRDLESAWRRWLRDEGRAGRLDIPRNRALEQALVESGEDATARLIYAEWLCEQPRGESYAEYLQLMAHNHRSWRAELLKAHDVAFLGPMAGAEPELVWRAGVIIGADCTGPQLELVLRHPAACALHHVDLELGETFPRLDEVPPRLTGVTLSVHEFLDAVSLTHLQDWLGALARGALRELTFTGLRLDEDQAALIAHALPAHVRVEDTRERDFEEEDD